jgi:rod shape-determining protein MreC
VARAVRSTSSRFDLIALGTCAILALIARGLPPNLRDPVATSMRRTFLAPLVMLQERAEASRRSLLLDQQRTAIRDSVALKAMAVSSLEDENGKLRRLVGLGGRLKWGFIPAEAIHGRGVRDVTTMTLTAGSLAGVRRLSPVVAPEGVVGMVTDVDPTMSQAMIWTHPDFRVSAMSEDGAAFGIVQAHLASATTGYLMELRGIPFRTALKPGTLIVSSGLGGVWPRGIPIGRVLEEVKTSEGWARTYLLKPAVSPADVGAVMILRADRISQGFDNVWTSVAAVDSAARAIVSAGDSLAKTAALAEAAARRAAIEAATRDTSSVQSSVPGGLPPELLPDTSLQEVAPISDSAAEARQTAARRAAIRRARRDSAARDSARRDSAARDTLMMSPTRGIIR